MINSLCQPDTPDVYSHTPIKKKLSQRGLAKKTTEKASIEFFKKEAQRLNTSYQGMIRNLLQEYTRRMKER